MNTHLEPQIRHSGVTTLGNRPAITCNLRLAVTNLDAQSAVPRINRDALMLIRRWFGSCLLLLAALGLSACGGNVGSTAQQNGDLVIGITDADGEFLAYAVDVALNPYLHDGA